MKDVEIIGMLKSYVQKSLVGVGALKGTPCKIQSITDGDDFHTVKFEWTDDAGTSHTSDMIVNDGSDIASITQDGATITVELSDGTSHDFIVPTVQGPKGDKGDKGDTGEGMPEGGTAGQVLVKESSTDYDMEWKSLNIPSKTSDLTNDSGFIIKVVDDLVNYYLKSETYSKTEVDEIVTAIKNSRFEVVATLPTTDIKTNVIYLVPKDPAQTSNVKDEYINLDGTTSGWEKIGDTEIDLSGYVTTQALNTALADYTTTADLTTLLAAKQDTLTFDDAPTENSNNPVKSGGVFVGLAGKADKVSGATNGNFAGLNANGNLTDSGKKASDFALAGGLTDEIKKRFVNNCKNVLPIRLKSQTARGVTFTRNENDSFSLSGTCTGNPLTIDLFSASVYTNTGDSSAFKIEKGIVIDKTKPYILTRGDTQIRFTLTLYQDGVSVATVGFDSTGGNPFMEIDFSSYTFNEIKAIVRFGNNTSYNNKTFIPMLCLKSDYQVDSGQQYYAKTNKQLTDEIVGWDNFSELGAVNYIYPQEESSTKQGVLYTLNDDNSCTLSGTAEGGGGFQWLSYNGENLVGKELTLNAGNDAVYSDMYFAFICRATLGGENLLRHDVYLNKLNRTDTLTVPAGTKVILCGFNIPASYTGAVSMTLKPILTLASYNGPYVPHAKTNRELTEELTAESGDITRLVSFSAVTSYGVRKYGKVVELYFAGTLSEAVNTWTDFLTVPEGFRPSHYVQIASFNTYSSCKNLQLAPSGGIQSASNLSSGDFIRFSATYIID